MSFKNMFRKSGQKKDDGNFVGVTLFGNDLDSVAGHSAQPISPSPNSGAGAAPGSPLAAAITRPPRLFSEFIDDEAAQEITTPTGNPGALTFGTALSALPSSAFVKIGHLTVPKVLHYMVMWLQNHEVHSTEGVFRKQGRASQVKAAMEAVESGRMIEEDEALNDVGPLDVATLLAEYLHMLPEALLESRRDQFIDAMGSDGKKAQAMELRKAYLLLPKLNQDSTSYLLEFLSELAASEEVTKTTPKNMAVCFEAALFNRVDLQQLTAQQRGVHGEKRVRLITAIEILITRADHFH